MLLRHDPLTPVKQFTIGLSGEVLMPPDNKPMKVQPTMLAPVEKGDKHGATEFTEENIMLFFWDGPTKPKG